MPYNIYRAIHTANGLERWREKMWEVWELEMQSYAKAAIHWDPRNVYPFNVFY
jgi:hypothetical protein